MPSNIIHLLFFWFNNSFTSVFWNGFISVKIKIQCGVRQGGNLSPKLFACCVNKLIEKILKSGVGCHVGQMSMAIFMYADDLVLLSASIYITFNT